MEKCHLDEYTGLGAWIVWGSFCVVGWFGLGLVGLF